MEEGQVNGEEMVVTNQDAAELTKPCVGALDLPPSFVASQFPPVLISSLQAIVPVRCDQLDAPLFPSLSQRIGIITAIGNHPFGPLSRPAFALRDADLVERGVRKRNFCRRGTFQPNSQRNT